MLSDHFDSQFHLHIEQFFVHALPAAQQREHFYMRFGPSCTYGSKTLHYATHTTRTTTKPQKHANAKSNHKNEFSGRSCGSATKAAMGTKSPKKNIFFWYGCWPCLAPAFSQVCRKCDLEPKIVMEDCHVARNESRSAESTKHLHIICIGLSSGSQHPTV